MSLRPVHFFDTRAGRFFISVSDDGRFHPVFDGDSLGSYHSAAAAASDLAGGDTFSVPGVDDTAKLGIPEDVREWEKVP